MHPSDKYLLIRKHVFATYRKHGLKSALYTVESYKSKNELDEKHFKGIRGEIGFFDKYKDKLKLWESLDSGNHADFIGNLKGEQYGIDVTTNVETKGLESYSEEQKNGYKYLVALVDPETLALQDVFNINFPSCAKCGGKLVDVLLLLPSDRDNEGYINYQFTQKTVSVCSSNPYEHNILGQESNYMTWDFNSYLSELPYSYDDHDESQQQSLDLSMQIDKYSISNLKFYKKQFGQNIVAVGSPEHIITNPKTLDGYDGTRLYYRTHFSKELLPEIFEADISIV